MERFSLDPSEEEMRAMLAAATKLVVDHLSGLQDAPAADLADAEEVAASLRGTPGIGQRAFDAVLDDIARAIPKSFNTAGPGYLAYIPGGGLFLSAVAELIANAVNRYTALWAPAPALTQIEVNVVRWMADLFDYPADARGILTSGGSLANFSALVAARATKLGEDFLDGTLYLTEHTHASVAKAARLAGFPTRAIRTVPSDPTLRMDAERLRAMIAEDRAAGARPFCIVASAGTTNTGAIDPIAALADIARDEQMWLHVDGAYGGFFQLTERGRVALDGIARADSITLDPHKGMFLPYGTGALVVRDGEALRAAHSEGIEAHYLQDLGVDEHAVDFADYSPELSRENRGLRVWLPLEVHGAQAFADALTEKLELSAVLAEGIRAIDGLQITHEPQLTVIPFRFIASDDPDASSKRLLERINASKRIFLSSTIIDGHFIIRACILNHRTDRARIDEAISIIADAAWDEHAR